MHADGHGGCPMLARLEDRVLYNELAASPGKPILEASIRFARNELFPSVPRAEVHRREQLMWQNEGVRGPLAVNGWDFDPLERRHVCWLAEESS